MYRTFEIRGFLLGAIPPYFFFSTEACDKNK